MPFEPSIDPPKGWAPSGAGLTHTQLRLIGQVTTGWAILEIALQHILITLTQSPDHLGQSLTEDLGPDHRLKALNRLCRHWQNYLEPNPPKDESLDVLAQTKSCGAWIQKNKDMRNRVAHWWWSRASDELMFCYKFTLKRHAADEGAEIGNFAYVKNEELEEFASEISEKTTLMLWLWKMLDKKLPTWPRKHD